MLLLIPLFGETPIVRDEDQTLYLFMQSFLERPGTASEIFSQRSGVFTGNVFSACSSSFCSSVVQGEGLDSVLTAGGNEWSCSERDDEKSLCFTRIFACWVFTKNTLHYHLVFALACIGKKSTFMAAGARWKCWNPPINAFSAQLNFPTWQPYMSSLPLSWNHWQTLVFSSK